MWAIIQAIISGIIGPITNTITAIYTQKINQQLEEYKVDGQIDISLVNAAVAIAGMNATLLQNKWMIRLQVAFGLPLAVYYGKCILWDKVFALGSTDPLRGDISTYSLWIVGFLFLHSSIAVLSRK